jgi:hypothetical protein
MCLSVEAAHWCWLAAEAEAPRCLSVESAHWCWLAEALTCSLEAGENLSA